MFKSPSVPRPPYPFPSEVGCLRPSRPPPRGICGLAMRLFLDFGNSPSSLVTSARGSVVQVLSPHRTPRYLILGHLQRSRALATRSPGWGVCCRPLAPPPCLGPSPAWRHAIGQVLPTPRNPAAPDPPRARFRCCFSTGGPWHSATSAVRYRSRRSGATLPKGRRYFGGKICERTQNMTAAFKSRLGQKDQPVMRRRRAMRRPSCQQWPTVVGRLRVGWRAARAHRGNRHGGGGAPMRRSSCQRRTVVGRCRDAGARRLSDLSARPPAPFSTPALWTSNFGRSTQKRHVQAEQVQANSDFWMESGRS